MQPKLLELKQADQMSDCKLSLLLGVSAPRNQIDIFLKMARRLLNVESAVWAFHHEPYVWFVTQQGFQACSANHKLAAQLQACYTADHMPISPKHPNYLKFSDHLKQHSFEHQRLLALNLTVNDSSIGQLVFFDQSDDEFNPEDIEQVEVLLEGMLGYIELQFEHAELKEAYEQLSALNFSRTKFFQIIAHDLRAPFHGLLGFSDVLAEELDTLDHASIQNIASYLNDTAKSTYNLLENLLNWAMAEGGRFVYHPINFKLKQSSHIVVDVLNSLAMKKKICLVDQVPDDIRVFADINMLTSVLQNLTSNALKFTPVDGTGQVIISACVHEQQVELSVTDTGLGMTEQQVQHVFEPRIKTSLKGTAGERGTGLGLVLCKRFVDLNHGEIRVTSKEGQGTTFTVILPKAQDDHSTLVQQQDQLAAH
ncbi:sensor histidine kinase [Acinetobacter sp. MB5]|uniref:sensor histidine kinase n=1 Tax=Acinetobacter sp. MB5 TaxID=2069438 RepID=UPI000DD083BA|nr:HAMP domain-containing sensor histidine kinase [Acinetobacter sp. MB5]